MFIIIPSIYLGRKMISHAVNDIRRVPLRFRGIISRGSIVDMGRGECYVSTDIDYAWEKRPPKFGGILGSIPAFRDNCRWLGVFPLKYHRHLWYLEVGRIGSAFALLFLW